MRPIRHMPLYIKLTRREYWPMWVYYFPVWLQHLWLSVRVRNLFFFLATNPAIEGFILSDSKDRTLRLVPEEFRPRSLLIEAGAGPDWVLEELRREGIPFPVILKPDVGFRGVKVQKIDDASQLSGAVLKINVPYLLQEYCSDPMELGVFYYRYPDQPRGCISSITLKEFLTVTGDGIHSLKELVHRDPRALLQKQRLLERYADTWDLPVAKGTELVLEVIGNHNLGTTFRDGSHLADDALLDVFDALSHRMPGFYFGRFDIKTKSWKALKEDRAFTILEVNGIGGEPTHIYDPDTSLLHAWKALCGSWQVAARIARINFNNGIERPSYARAKRLWRQYTEYRSRLFAKP